MSDQDRPNPYDAVISDLRAKKEQEIKRITDKYDAAISALTELAGSGLSAAPALDAVTGESVEIQIRVGEFHGMTLTSAARTILAKGGRPMRTDEIVKHVEKSGRKLEAANPSANLYSSLKRNPDFELVAPNTWGLAEWYPGRSRKSKPMSVAAKAEEIMQQGTISIAEATQRAEEIVGEHTRKLVGFKPYTDKN